MLIAENKLALRSSREVTTLRTVMHRLSLPTVYVPVVTPALLYKAAFQELFQHKGSLASQSQCTTAIHSLDHLFRLFAH
jgi:hypothetical protein